MNWQRLAVSDTPAGAAVLDRPAPAVADAPTAAAPPALRVADLGKGFRSGLLRRRLRGVDGVSFTVRPGEIFALLGHNGAGKTTTINCILDLCRAETGTVEIFGVDHRDAKSRLRVGYLPERPYFFDHLTGVELLRFYGKLLELKGADLERRIGAVLGRVGMADRAGLRLRRMSKGMLQRLGLAQAILGDADLLILDEPMSGLDPIGRREVRELLLELKQAGRTILLSSHIVPDVELLADTVGVLKAGRLVRTCDRAELCGGAAYVVNAGDLGRGADRWPAWLREAAPACVAGRLRIPAADASGLRRVLEQCHRDGLPVDSVETRGGGLEELFVQVHTAPEVVR
ncbi:MAG: ABC transporter ATP-binding protein [Candidatus Krumholzibacteriia bacterium]